MIKTSKNNYHTVNFETFFVEKDHLFASVSYLYDIDSNLRVYEHHSSD